MIKKLLQQQKSFQILLLETLYPIDAFLSKKNSSPNKKEDHQ
jgi:hypothetical protein